MDLICFQIQIKYETKHGEEIYIYGDSPDFGSWRHPKFRLRWSQGHVWKANYQMQKSNNPIKFKFVCHSNNGDKWEEGENRLLSPQNLNGLPKTGDGKYILDCVWNHFKINFNIHYVPTNPNAYMQIVGAPDALANWQKTNEKPVKMELQNDKEITAKDGNKITGFWTVTALMRLSDKRNLDFEYRYSLYDPKSGTAIWEREPNRHVHFFLTQDEIATFDDPKISPDSCYLLTNSYLEILDVNFVANLVFNRMGDKKIYIGPYPQSEEDFKIIAESGIDSILNVQSDKDLIFRQINHQLQLKQAKNLGITINRYPIEDFNQEDLFEKLKGAGDLLNKLMQQGKTVYVHCTAGMSRAAATVIIYLVLYENYTVEDATNFCKKHRPVICPNYGVINRIASIYKPGSEMREGSMFNFTPSSYSSKIQKEIDKEKEKEIAKEKERRRLREQRRQERIEKERKLKEKERKEQEELEQQNNEEKPKKKIIKKKVKVKKKVKADIEQENDNINNEKNQIREIIQIQEKEDEPKKIVKKKLITKPKKKLVKKSEEVELKEGEGEVKEENDKPKKKIKKIIKKKVVKDINEESDKKKDEKIEENNNDNGEVKKKIIKKKIIKKKINKDDENNEKKEIKEINEIKKETKVENNDEDSDIPEVKTVKKKKKIIRKKKKVENGEKEKEKLTQEIAKEEEIRNDNNNGMNIESSKEKEINDEIKENNIENDENKADEEPNRTEAIKVNENDENENENENNHEINEEKEDHDEEKEKEDDNEENEEKEEDLEKKSHQLVDKLLEDVNYEEKEESEEESYSKSEEEENEDDN